MSREATSYPAFHTTGPIYHYVRCSGVYGSGPIFFLGTCEVQPQLRINRYSKAVFNDIGGRSVPMQETHDGEDADMGLALSRYSEPAYQALQAFNASGSGAATSVFENNGVESYLSRGSLIYGPRTFEMWQWHGFYGTAAVSAQNEMTPGFYWPQVKLNAHEMLKHGTEGKVLLLTVKATPRWINQPSGPHTGGVSGTSTGLPGQFLLRSSALSSFPVSTRGGR